MQVGEYLAARMREPWVWGRHDCCTLIADWCIAQGRADPMAFIRGRYDSERSALRRIRRGRGLLPLWQRGMRESGISVVAEDEMLMPGDVAVIERQTVCGTDQAMGLWTGSKWATLALRGVECAPADTVAVWRP